MADLLRNASQKETCLDLPAIRQNRIAARTHLLYVCDTWYREASALAAEYYCWLKNLYLSFSFGGHGD